MDLVFDSADSKLYGLTIFVSIVAFQIAYILLQWYYLRRADFLYYVGYMISMLVYGLSQFEEYLPFRFFTALHDDANLFTRHSLPFFSAFLYFRFQRSFLNLPETRPVLNVWVVRLEYLIVSYGILSPVLIALGASVQTESYVFNLVNAVVLVSSAVIIFSFLKHSNPLTRFAMLGAGFMVLGSVVSVIFLIKLENGYPVGFDPFLPLLVCVIAELLTFTTGLSYKTRLIELEKLRIEHLLLNELQEKQKLEIAMYSMRNNIARDLHDEIGSGLSKISLMGEVMKKEGKFADARLDKIIFSAKEMAGGMGEMVWSLNTNNDKVDSLIYFLRKHAVEYLEDSGIELKIQTPPAIDAIHVTGMQRSNVLMVFKEALNNIIKHSKATRVQITIAVNDKKLHIMLHDNGIGLSNNGHSALSNGLKNMQQRMSEINGVCSIYANNGTVVEITLPL